LRSWHWEWTAYQGLAEAYGRAGDVANEMKYHERKIQKAWSNYRHAPEYVDFLLGLGESYRNLGDALALKGAREEGMENLRQARRLIEPYASHSDWRLPALLKRIMDSFKRYGAREE
jgi:tetratricopeptide (TPR) repeat protein